MIGEFIPKSYLYLKNNYSRILFKKDLIAGITVGIISLPLAMAFGIASGVNPAQGLITAIIAGFLISAFGGSRIQIGGPTGAFIVLVYDIVQRHGYAGLCLATLFAGALLIVFGLLRLGSWIKYVSHPLITGLTTGIALILFSSQIKPFFGLPLEMVPNNFIEKWHAYIGLFPIAHLPTLLFACATLIAIILIRRFTPRIPWGIAAIVLATVISSSFSLPVATIESTFGLIPSSILSFALPSFSIDTNQISGLVRDGIAIALLGGIESLLSAVIGDSMLGGGRHKSNCELVGQGIANIGSALFGGIPATGAIARTAMNVKAGAQSPVAGMIHAITLLCLVTFFSPFISKIPMPALAAVLVMVAWNMSEISHFLHLLRAPKGDVIVLLSTFLLTIAADITTAILFGILLSSLFFMKKMSDCSKKIPLQALLKESQTGSALKELNHLPHTEVYEIQGPFFFGTADLLKDLLPDMSPRPKQFILRLSLVPFIDASGVHAIREFALYCHKHEIPLLLTDVQPDVKKILTQMGLKKLCA